MKCKTIGSLDSSGDNYKQRVARTPPLQSDLNQNLEVFMQPLELVHAIADILDEKKAVDITAIHTTEQTIIADYFLVATGTSSTHVKALTDDLEFEMKRRHGVMPKGVEGRASGWILLDYGTVLVHVFQQEQREYYNIERLWEDAEKIELDL